ncbi:MAG TPA: AAA family ATPase [Bacteroidales bacterium]|nr:MAG: AAA family ATPase [Bacteroidetes bacterium GWE2_42_24]OFY29306.1 MAG: AAA family ATPase [Bacteroidetes bacterium GWF2_43_11]HBZ66692.1 AAA family ATPase [Bacteroidales bacterium]
MTTTKNDITLRVKEALVKDVGRAIARIDPKEMKLKGLESGDVIVIEGKRSTPVKILPCYPEDRDKSIIQIDGITRENCQAGIDEKVKIATTSCRQATKIKLKPDTKSGSLFKADDAKYIGSLINGLPVVKGDKVRANLFGSRSVDYTITGTNPEGVVLIHPNTTFQLELARQDGETKRKISYEDIGGLGTQVQRIREMIELPLKYPEIFERLGIQAPKGVFMYGPPGTGKTLIVRAVAHETDAYFINISGPEIMGKFYGESEGRIRKIFEEAQQHAPAIIFIDEIDAIAPKREDMGGEKQVEKRVVAQLLSLMDGLESRGKVIVIGATNIPNAIDPALRRPGRFDREISISIPDKKGRLEILHIHTRGIPLSMDVDMEKLAEITHGFVGADLEALAREAAMTALRKILPQIDFEMAEIPYELLMSLEVTMDNFMDAMKEVEPSAIREVFVEVPDVKWDDVGGLDDIKQALKETVEWPLKYADLFKRADTKPPKGIILHGKPGTGKTYLAKALASESGVNFISVKGPQILSKYIGESEKGVRELFRMAKQASPCILFLDEIDSLTPRRSEDGSGSGVLDRVIGQFLTEMDGIEDLKGVIVLAATNRIDLIDPALLRSGRFDLLFEVPLPDVKTREKIFSIHTRRKILSKKINLNKLAIKTEGLTGSDIEFICRKAAMLAIRQLIDKNRDLATENAGELSITEKHFEEAIQLVLTQNASK